VEIGDKMNLHPWLKESTRGYGKTFAVVKKPKKIIWLTTVGFVALDVVDDAGNVKTYENCSMIHANILCWLVDKRRMTLTALSEALELPIDVTRRHVGFWMAEGVIREEHHPSPAVAGTPGDMTLICAAALSSGGNGGGIGGVMDVGGDDVSYDDGDDDRMMVVEGDGGGGSMTGAAGGAAGHEEEDMQQDLGPGTPAAEFVLHMLTNLGALGLDAIHRNLTLFGMSDWRQSDLAVLLDNLVVAGLVEMRGGELFVAVETKD
jgi:hypothetical protein